MLRPVVHMIVYDPFRETLKRRGISTCARIGALCALSDCRAEDIPKYAPDA